MILVFPTPLVIVQDIYGEMVVGSPFRPVGEGEQTAVLVKGFSLYDGSVPDLHADPVSGLQFVNTFKGHAQPSTPVKLLMRRALSWMLMIRRAATLAQPQHVPERAGDFETGAGFSTCLMLVVARVGLGTAITAYA